MLLLDKDNFKVSDLKDQELWRMFKDGDKKAFSFIYQQHIAALINYGIKICDDEIVLKDTIQDLFIELWNTRKNLSEVDCIKFYLFKSLRFKLIRTKNKKITVQKHLTSFQRNEEDLSDLSAEDRMIDEEIYETQTTLIEKAITSLSSRQKEVIQLRFYQGFTNEQIAALMQLNYQSVSNLIYTALLRIKDRMKTPVFASLFTILLLSIILQIKS
ncbi:MAG: sigma-70 family RNA polymerase sigma factor [Agriterribacter sp.]